TSATLTTPRARRGASRASQRVIPGADSRLPSPFATSTRSLRPRWASAMMAVAVRERLVRPDDLLDQLVTNHVPLVEVHERDALDPADHLHRLDQARRPARRQVDLRHVSGDDGLGSEPEAREEHLHLLGRRVLRFVENDE